MEKKIIILGISFLVFFLAISLVSAGFSDWFKARITGYSATNTTTLNITVGTNPVITNVSVIPAKSVTENSVTYVKFNFTARDTDGAGTINVTSATAKFNRSGEGSRANSSCVFNEAIDSTSSIFNCTVQLWYFDGAGDWGINVTIKDNSSNRAENATTGFTLSESTCMIMSPLALTWPSLGVTDVDTLSNNDPITLNNTCNDDIASGAVTVKAYNLRGEVTTTDMIRAGNFTTHTSDACTSGTQMVNGTATGVTGSILAGGNHSTNIGSTGQEQLYFCLEELNTSISPQSYSSELEGAWVVAIS
ncbi:MAG: hypothetical protein AABX73_03560 [Nanoarchaeota archaeon]